MGCSLGTLTRVPERQRRDLTLAQGNALGFHRKTNQSPERARQRMAQPWIEIGTPFQGFLEWGRVSQGVALGWSWNAPSGLAAPIEIGCASPATMCLCALVAGAAACHRGRCPQMRRMNRGVLMFAATNAAIAGPVPFATPFEILCGLTLMSVVIGPFGAAATLRHGME
jgi:hypothetical protein